MCGLSGISRPADSDSGDAQDGAHIPAEHGPAARREAGRLDGEQRACLRPQTGRLWRLLQQRYMICSFQEKQDLIKDHVHIQIILYVKITQGISDCLFL